MPDPTPHAVRTYVIEDSALILDNLVATLQETTPVQVVGTAGDEHTAMQWLLQPGHECDLIVVDIFLKSGSGLGVLQGVARAGLSARRVVLTNYASPDLRRHCRALGAHRVFDKSNEVDELIAYCAWLGDGGVGTAPGAQPD